MLAPNDEADSEMEVIEEEVAVEGEPEKDKEEERDAKRRKTEDSEY